MEGNQLKYKTFPVQADLQHLVKHIWTMDAEPNFGDYFVFRTYASIKPTLFFVVNGNVEPMNIQLSGKLFLLGQTNQWFRFKTSNDFKVFAVTFSPFAFPRLFKLSADSITNKVLDHSFISKNEFLSEFCQNVFRIEFNPNNVSSLISKLVPTTESKDENIISLITKISSSGIGITQLSNENVFMSQRNFERKFKYYSGFTPKAFSNLIRTINSLQTILFENRKLLGVTFEQNYFDQAHFSNEFKKHIGFQPRVFAKRSKEENYVWNNYVDFFQFLSICPPVLCKNKILLNV